jgi:CubicO group peptidase (beta-lactamase class C family)
VASLAVGIALGEGKLRSLDAPLSTWFAEFAVGDKAQVTLRHVLTHTSGIRHEPSPETISSQPDYLRYVRQSPLDTPPGKTFSYNNEAVELLAGVILSATGTPIDDYLKRKLFEPLGLAPGRWLHDAAGHAQLFSGLALDARDLARLGRLVLDGGRWSGRQLVPADYVREMVTPRGECGLLWWQHRSRDGKTIAYVARGYGGQYLAIYPERKLIAVRQRAVVRGDTDPAHQFPDFLDDLDALTR